MTLKTILVCLTTKEHAADLMKVAVPLARRCGAHLVGLHTLEAMEVYPGIAMHVTSGMYDAFRTSQKDETDAIEKIFRAHSDSEDFISEFRVLRSKTISASERMLECARAADLVIMAQEDHKNDRHDQRRAQADVIRYSGRPVIIVPLDYEGPEIGNRLLLGWSDTREAARAARDMLSIAREGASIDVLRVAKHAFDEMEDADLLDISVSLARHGHKVDVHHVQQADQGIAEVLTAKAFELGSDLVVTGAFGHSSAYDFVLGATSHSLLRDAKVPVMFSK